MRKWDAKRSGWQPAVSKDVNQDAWQSEQGAQSGGARHYCKKPGRSVTRAWTEGSQQKNQLV